MTCAFELLCDEVCNENITHRIRPVLQSELNFGIWNDNLDQKLKPTKKSQHKYSSLYSSMHSS